jgi:asparaginyl-tRNA synthetase
MAVHNFFQEREFINIHTPIITSNDCEGAGELFHVVSSTDIDGVKLQTKPINEKFFGVDKAYLTVSGQLHGEIFACSMSKIYTFGPTFRAEKSDTPRHLAEFWMIEPEVAFADLNQILQLAEDFVRFCVRQISKKCEKDMEFFQIWVNKENKAALETVLRDKTLHSIGIHRRHRFITEK